MNVLDLFSGYGGLNLGFKAAIPTARTVAYVEWDAHAIGVLISRMVEGDLEPAPIYDDISSFDGKPWKGKVDCIIGGFPCTDISVAGKGAGIVEGKTRSGLWYEYARIIGEIQPTFVFIENVRALLTRGIDQVLGSLSEMGYDSEWGVVSAADAGACHKRERVFILAYATAIRLHNKKDEQIMEGERWSELLSIKSRNNATGEAKPSVGGAANVSSSWLDMPRMARPGQEQYEHEEPRTITGDLAWRSERLKRTGNGVVPQQAALAIKLILNNL